MHDGYVLSFDEIFRKIDETIAVGGVQLLLQGGHNPDLPLQWYEDLFRAVKSRYPDFKLHALSPPEVIHLSRMSRLPVPDVIDAADRGRSRQHSRRRRRDSRRPRPQAAQLLQQSLRRRMARRHAPRPSRRLRTTATMMYGTVETMEERLEHLVRLREVQDETGGFTAFITWSYQPEHTERGGREATGIEYLRTLAIARLVLDNFDNLQASWVTQGRQSRATESGVWRQRHGQRDDRGERRSRGRRQLLHGRSRDRPQRRGRRLRRQAPQHALRHPRRSDVPLREVPRMLELATARADGDHSVPAELLNYPARSAAGKRLRETGGEAARPQ